MYVHLDRSGYAMYSRATATAWILLEALGTIRFTVSLSSSDNMEGMVAVPNVSCRNSEVPLISCVAMESLPEESQLRGSAAAQSQFVKDRQRKLRQCPNLRKVDQLPQRIAPLQSSKRGCRSSRGKESIAMQASAPEARNCVADKVASWHKLSIAWPPGGYVGERHSKPQSRAQWGPNK